MGGREGRRGEIVYLYGKLLGLLSTRRGRYTI